MENPLAPGGELYWLVESRYQESCGIKIEKKLQINPKHLKFEARICEGVFSTVYKGM